MWSALNADILFIRVYNATVHTSAQIFEITLYLEGDKLQNCNGEGQSLGGIFSVRIRYTKKFKKIFLIKENFVVLVVPKMLKWLR